MSLPSLSIANWWLGVFLEVFVLCIACVRKLGSRLPFFFAYLALLVANEIILFAIYRLSGLNSKLYLYGYWLLQFTFITLRAVVVYEVCQRILSAFVGVWKLVNRLLFVVAGVLGIVVLLSAYGNPYRITAAILTEERGLELVVVCLLVAGLAFCRYYRVRFEHYLVWVALGLGFYSAVQIADNTFLHHWSSHWASHFAVWEALRHYSFDVALLMWIWALKEPLPAKEPAPALLSSNVYQTLSPVITTRLRELNTRLLEIWK